MPRGVSLSPYEWQVGETMVDCWGMTVHIRVRRRDGRPNVPWYVLQLIKNEVAGEYATAIEVFPPHDEVVDEVNMRHLWVVPENVPVPSLARR